MIASALHGADRLAPAAAAALREATITDTRAEDMASIARSVSVPGLKERIRAFREAQKK